PHSTSGRRNLARVPSTPSHFSNRRHGEAGEPFGAGADGSAGKLMSPLSQRPRGSCLLRPDFASSITGDVLCLTRSSGVQLSTLAGRAVEDSSRTTPTGTRPTLPRDP